MMAPGRAQMLEGSDPYHLPVDHAPVDGGVLALRVDDHVQIDDPRMVTLLVATACMALTSSIVM